MTNWLREEVEHAKERSNKVGLGERQAYRSSLFDRLDDRPMQQSGSEPNPPPMEASKNGETKLGG